MNFIELFDAVVHECKPTLGDYKKPESMDVELSDLGLDSLDFALIFMTLGDMHGIPEEIGRQSTRPHNLAERERFHRRAQDQNVRFDGRSDGGN